MVRTLTRAGLTAAILLAVAVPAWAADPVGRIKTQTGAAQVTRAGQSQPLVPGDWLYPGDEIATQPASSLGFVLEDDTTMALGPSSKMVLEHLSFEPAADKLDMGLMLKTGSFSVQSGQIAKLAPARTEIRTPQMSIGIRGTSFLVKVENDE